VTASAIPPPGVIGVDEAARRPGVSRATVYNWIDGKRLIGRRLTRQGTYIPGEQIVGPGELVEGIDQVLRIIPDHRAAWRFLDERSPYIDGEERPIDEYSTRVNRPMMLVDLRGSACVELGAPTDAVHAKTMVRAARLRVHCMSSMRMWMGSGISRA
jgi:hypothetical protein